MIAWPCSLSAVSLWFACRVQTLRERESPSRIRSVDFVEVFESIDADPTIATLQGCFSRQRRIFKLYQSLPSSCLPTTTEQSHWSRIVLLRHYSPAASSNPPSTRHSVIVSRLFALPNSTRLTYHHPLQYNKDKHNPLVLLFSLRSHCNGSDTI